MKRSSLLQKQNKKIYEVPFGVSNKQSFKSSSKITNQLYYDNTSPLMTLQKSNQKSIFKSQIHNNVIGNLFDSIQHNYFIGKINHYHNKSTLQLQNSKKADLLDRSYPQLKAASVLYKIPQFSVPALNFQISSAIQKKVQQIKQDFITHLPDITKSSNFNPRKIQNTFNHRSSILQLQQWLKNKLVNPPKTLQQSLEYKNMIMGIGMKDIIRIINKRCLEQGKMVEQIWQLTWGVCREIILHLSQRVRKCQDVLQKQVINVNKGFKDNMTVLRKQVIQSKQKLAQYQLQNKQMQIKIKQLQSANQILQQQNRKRNLEISNCNEEFLNILQENLALYLHVGDKNKKDWIKRMYKKVDKAKNSIKKTYKQNITKVYQKRAVQENIYQDQEQGQQIQYDEDGNVSLEVSKRKINKKIDGQINNMGQGNIVQNGQSGQKQNKEVQVQGQEHHQKQQVQQQHDQLLNLKQTLQAQFQTIQIQTQTQPLPIAQVQTQCQQKQTQQRQTQYDLPIGQQIGVNTQESQFMDILSEQNKHSKNSKSKSTKNQKDKKSMKNMTGNINSKSNLKLAKKNSVTQGVNKNDASMIGTDSNFKAMNNTVDQLSNDPLSIERKFNSSNQKIFEYICKDCQQIKRNMLGQQSCMQSLINNMNMNNDINLNNDRSPIRSNSKKNTLKSSNPNYNPQFMKNPLQQQQLQDVDNSRFKQKSDSQPNQDDIVLYNRRDSQNFKEIQQIKNKSRKKRDSSLIHDLGFKKEIQKYGRLGEQQGLYGQDQMDGENGILRLSIYKKEQYYKLFLDQLKYSNQQFINEIVTTQGNSENILNHYFSMVQQINSIPDSKIAMGQKQMLSIIQKNLMPIILQLLSSVKKSIAKKNLDNTIRTFHSLPYTVMKKLSTKYGVKILAMKNMRLLLSSLKKIQSITDRYKSLKLMLFTDCRAVYSQDLFVYLLIFSTITPMLDVDRIITFEQVAQVREICQKYLTKDKKVYEEFQMITKDQCALNKDQMHTGLKISPLIRSIITNYRIVKLNRIQEIGFVFLMLNKQNYLQFQVFSYFMSCLKLQLQVKLKIVKTFLANCDIKTKLKKVAISESGFSKFLIRCPDFNFQMLSFIVQKQKEQIDKMSTNKKSRKSSKKVSIQPTMKQLQVQGNQQKKIQQINQNQQKFDKKAMRSNVSLKDKCVVFQQKQKQKQQPISQIQKQKSIQGSRKDFKRKTQYTLKHSQTQLMAMRSHKNHRMTSNNNMDGSNQKIQISKLPQKLRDYSYFTYRIAMFLEDPQLAKYISLDQRQFLQNYIQIHIMHCQVQQIIGIIDYFSNEMLEIICVEQKQLSILNNDQDNQNNTHQNNMGQASSSHKF